MLQLEPVLQVRHLLLHGGWQAPFSQTRSDGQVTPAHAATQTPRRQDCPCGHMTPSQPPTQVPRWQTCPALHVLPMQSRSLQSPSVESQVRPTAQGNSLSSQKWRQTPWLQTSLGGQSCAFVDHAVAVVVLVVALLGRRHDGLAAGGRRPAARALGDAARADPHRVRHRAGIAAEVAGQAADVEDEVVEVAVVLRVAALPAHRAGRKVFERDVIGLRVGDRLVDQHRHPRHARGVLVVELGLRVLGLRALAAGEPLQREADEAALVVGAGADVPGEVGLHPAVLGRLRGHHRGERTEVLRAAQAIGRRRPQIRGNERVDLVVGRLGRRLGRVVPAKLVQASAAVQDDGAGQPALG